MFLTQKIWFSIEHFRSKNPNQRSWTYTSCSLIYVDTFFTLVFLESAIHFSESNHLFITSILSFHYFMLLSYFDKYSDQYKMLWAQRSWFPSLQQKKFNMWFYTSFFGHKPLIYQIFQKITLICYIKKIQWLSYTSCIPNHMHTTSCNILSFFICRPNTYRIFWNIPNVFHSLNILYLSLWHG